jgi:hypothetical protein
MTELPLRRWASHLPLKSIQRGGGLLETFLNVLYEIHSDKDGEKHGQ